MEPQVLFRGRWGWGCKDGVLGGVCVVVWVVYRVVCVVVRVVCGVVCVVVRVCVGV